MLFDHVGSPSPSLWLPNSMTYFTPLDRLPADGKASHALVTPSIPAADLVLARERTDVVELPHAPARGRREAQRSGGTRPFLCRRAQEGVMLTTPPALARPRPHPHPTRTRPHPHTRTRTRISA